MKDKEIKIRADEDFIEKVDYLQRINGHKNRSETIRKTVEKEYRKETIIIKESNYKTDGMADLRKDLKVLYEIPFTKNKRTSAEEIDEYIDTFNGKEKEK